MDDGTESGVSSWAWGAITVLAWPAWHWASGYLSAYPLSWLAAVTPSAEREPSGPGGLYDSPSQILILAAIGLLFGFLGVYLLRRLRAPHVVWIPATVVSLLMNLTQAVFWAGFSGHGTGAAHMAVQFTIAAGISALIGIGAWLGSRTGRSA